jgi:hypothetical protein
MILTNTIDMLENMMKQIDKHRQEDPDSEPDHPEGESPAERVKWAIAVVEEESVLVQELLADLRESLTAVCLLEVFLCVWVS